jgi:orotidine-5'-phosphate decarboxylase
LVCAGLDLDPRRIPPSILDIADEDVPERHPQYLFGIQLAVALAPYVGSFKLNRAHFEAGDWRGMRAMEWLVRDIKELPLRRPVLYDTKSGDVGSSTELYALAAARWGFDGATVNAYGGMEPLMPFLYGYPEMLWIVWCVSSNPGSNEFQRLFTAQIGLDPDRMLWRRVADSVARLWERGYRNLGAVGGATFPNDVRDLREIVGPEVPLLLPGFGAQGARIEAALPASQPGPVLLNNSSGVIYRSTGADFAEAAVGVVVKMNTEVRQVLGA